MTSGPCPGPDRLALVLAELVLVTLDLQLLLANLLADLALLGWGWVGAGRLGPDVLPRRPAAWTA